VSPDQRTVGDAIRAALLTADPAAKAMAARKVARDWRIGRLTFGFATAMPDRPARPAAPVLQAPGRMPKRKKAGSLNTRFALWHALAHIEFVAIDLALDMAGRFGAQMGSTFVSDFLKVAADEAMHFALLDRHLRSLGSHYGALPAHDGLWQAAEDTRHDVAARLAVVPMVLEARGLDVTPAMIERVRGQGDERGARILERIYVDEIRHVRVGVTHFNECARIHGHEAESLWISLVRRHFRGGLKPPFNDSARSTAGLSLSACAALAC
jgi:uncharacterized ferritin-like protein (DUF455 family)